MVAAPILALVLLATTPSSEPLKRTPEGKVLRPQIPKDCANQCQFLEDVGDQECRRTIKEGDDRRGECLEVYVRVKGTCLDSCREKGKFDEEYIRAQLPKIQAELDKQAAEKAGSRSVDPRAKTAIEADKVRTAAKKVARERAEAERKEKERLDKERLDKAQKEQAAKKAQAKKESPPPQEQPEQSTPGGLSPTRTPGEGGAP